MSVINKRKLTTKCLPILQRMSWANVLFGIDTFSVEAPSIEISLTVTSDIKPKCQLDLVKKNLPVHLS